MSDSDETFRPRLGRPGQDSAAPRQGLARSLRRITSGRSRKLSSLSKVPVRRWSGTRRAVIKARVVRLGGKGMALQRAHLSYLTRDGTGRGGERGSFYDGEREDVSGRDWLARGSEDRHHFRLIVSAEDSARLGDLKPFIRDLVSQMEMDLQTRLDWIAMDHHDTEHPHTHLLVRGRRDDGRDLVIDRDYISSALRARAGALLTRELGLETPDETELKISRAVPARRLTALDRQMVRQSGARGVFDLASLRRHQDHYRARLQVLQGLGLAEPLGRGQWRLAEGLAGTLAGIERETEAAVRIGHHLRAAGPGRAPGYALGPEDDRRALIARVVAMGLADEHTGSFYAILDGADGRVHHLSLAAGQKLVIGDIVRVESGVSQRLASLSLDAQVHERGLTFLDNWLAGDARSGVADAGFGRELRGAGQLRLDVLEGRGQIGGLDQPSRPDTRLLTTLAWQSAQTEGAALSGRSLGTHEPASAYHQLSGTLSAYQTPAGANLGMMRHEMGFALVPWAPEFDSVIGKRLQLGYGPNREIERVRLRDLGLGR